MIGNSLTHYRITAKLGEGGMGEVYRATDTTLGREVAIKVLPPSFSRDPQSLARFEREAKALASLNHPHIACIYGFEAEKGTHFIVLELVEGETLAERLRRGPLPVKEALTTARQIAEALQEAHEKGIIHRDFKPGNVKITPNGRVKVLDFGLAKMSSAAQVGRAVPSAPQVGDNTPVGSQGTGSPPNINADTPTLLAETTLPGAVMGTPAYMSPEQARGQVVDQRTDVWAFGCCLYECLSGRKPFQGRTASDLMAEVLKSEPDWSQIPHETPREVVTLLRRCLEKESSRRLSSLGDIAITLDESSRGHVELHHARSDEDPTSAARAERQGRETGFGAQKSIAVLPFVNMSSDRENEFLSDGITEDLITALSQIEGLRVPARTSSFAFKGRNEDIRKIGEQLSVTAVLEGSVRKSGNKLRITAQLINIADGYHLWSARFDREMQEVLAVQDEITRAIVDALKLKLTDKPDATLVKRHSDKAEAYQLYLKGRYLWNLRGEHLKKGKLYFELALLEDPHYALAYSGLADSFNGLGFYGFVPPREAVPQAKAAALRALAIDETLAEAHTSLAYLSLFFEWDWATAQKELLRALELNPFYIPARYWHAVYLTIRGQAQEAIAEIKRAEELDPLSVSVRWHVGLIYYLQRQFDQAIREFQKAIQMDPNLPVVHRWLGRAYHLSGRPDEALAEWQTFGKLSGMASDQLQALDTAYQADGMQGYFRKLVEQMLARAQHGFESPLSIALAYAWLGERDRALEWLDRAYEARDPGLHDLSLNPYFDSLHSDPRFVVLLRRMGLEE